MTELPKLDLDSYIAAYEGRTRYIRLVHIGKACPHLREDSLLQAQREAKGRCDADGFELAVKELDASEQDRSADHEWAESTRLQTSSETERLEAELKGYKNNLIKESIRMGYQDLAKHLRSIGDLGNATKALNKMQDYLTTNAQLVSLVMQAILVAVDEQNWYSAGASISRLWSNGMAKYDEAKRFERVITSVQGLIQLASMNFRQAADNFLAIEFWSSASLPAPGQDLDMLREIISPTDVAIYGGLCALASYSREDLLSMVLNGKKFRSFLELEPHIRNAISCFVISDFKRALSILRAWRVDFEIDLYLGHCIDQIYTQISQRAMSQYLRPYDIIGISAMSACFAQDEQSIESEVTKLIANGSVEARIDKIEKSVVAFPAGPSIGSTLASFEGYEATTYLNILHHEVQSKRLEIRHTKDSATASSGPGMESC